MRDSNTEIITRYMSMDAGKQKLRVRTCNSFILFKMSPAVPLPRSQVPC